MTTTKTLNASNRTPSPTPFGYKPVATWPLFRFAQRNFRGRWEVAPAIPDKRLAQVGYRLGGPYRDASALSERERVELYDLIASAKDAQTTEDRGREAELLSRCPFGGPMPPIDLDVKEGTDREVLRQAAEDFTAASCLGLLGAYRWHTTGGKGLHGDWEAPPGCFSTLLLRAMGQRLREFARAAKLPLLSDHRLKEDRPPVVVDDSLYERDADARGVVWRLAGSQREEGGVKLPIGGIDFDYPIQERTVKDIVLNFADYLRQVESWDLRADELRAALEEPGERRIVAARYAATAGIRRQAQNLRRLEKMPIDLGPSIAGLKHVAAQLVDNDPGHGRRHELRLAVAGWLLSSRIQSNVVAATLASLGDVEDANDAVRTTEARVNCGENVKGIGFIRRVYGEPLAAALRGALHADLAKAGVAVDLRQRLTTEDRQTLRDAAQIASGKWDALMASLPEEHALRRKYTGKGGPHATALRRAAKCGFARQRSECEGCGKGDAPRWISAENFLCPHCAAKWAAAMDDWIDKKWASESVSCYVRKLNDDSLETCLAERKMLRYKLDCGMFHYSTNARFIMAPGYLAVVSTHPGTSSIVESVYGTMSLPEDRMTDIEEVRRRLAPVLAARASRLRQFLATKNLDALATDGWVTRVVSTKCGRKAKEFFPWPTKLDLRAHHIRTVKREKDLEDLSHEDALVEAKIPCGERRTKCCNAHYVWKLLTDKGEVAASRRDKPWTSEEAYHFIREFAQTGVTYDGNQAPLYAPDWDDSPCFRAAA